MIVDSAIVQNLLQLFYPNKGIHAKVVPGIGLEIKRLF